MNKSQRHKRDHIRKMIIDGAGYFGGACPECGGEIMYYYKFDAFCCLKCGIWLDEKCPDPDCPYCSNRPDGSLHALFSEKYRPEGKQWRIRNYQHKEQGKIRKENRIKRPHKILKDLQ